MMMTTTRNSPIPDKALASHIAILGKAGSGKTWAAKGLAERVLDADGRVCVIDPTGVWHGLRTLANGRAGYPVAIFGGEHADFPLFGTHGETLADIVATSSTPAVIDTALMRVSERTRFFADFADTLLRKNKGPLHLIIDEAHLFAPQGKVNDPQSGMMLHAANNMVSLGRSRGLRIVMISQRPAKLHKDSLTQVETLVAMRLIAPQDRSAVEDWIADNADEKRAKEIITTLATLKTGQAWVWAPQLDVLERVTFPKIRTLDTSAAPDGRADEKRVLAPIDRDTITARLGQIARDADANDPKKLRAKLAELERQLKAKPGAAPAVSREAVQAAEQRGYERGAVEAQRAASKALKSLKGDVHQAVEGAFHGVLALPVDTPVFTPVRTPVSTGVKPRPATVQTRGNGASEKMGKAERKFLTVLAQRQEKRTTRNQVAIFAGYSSKSGHVDNTLGALRSAGHAQGGADDVRITEAGLAALGDFDPLPTGEELRRYWLEHAGGKAERAMLEVILKAYPEPLTRNEVAEAANYSTDSGHVDNTLGRLRSLDLIQGPGSAIRASEELFD
jgi:hypothetical protein